METIVLDTLGKLNRYGHGMFGWCSECSSPSRYWDSPLPEAYVIAW